MPFIAPADTFFRVNAIENICKIILSMGFRVFSFEQEPNRAPMGVGPWDRALQGPLGSAHEGSQGCGALGSGPAWGLTRGGP